MRELLADLALQSTRRRLVEARHLEVVGHVGLTGGIGFRLVVGVAILPAVAQLLHELGRRVAQVQRHRARAVVLHEITRRIIGDVGRVALRCTCQIDHRLRDREFALGGPEPLVGFAGIERELQATRVGDPDVLDRHADHASAHVQRVGTAVQHAAAPVQRGVGVRPAHGLVQRRDLVVEGFAALVEAAQVLGEGALQEFLVDVVALRRARGRADRLQHVEQPPRVAVGRPDHHAFRAVGESEPRQRAFACALEEHIELFGGQRVQDVHRGARQQRPVHLE